MNRNARPPRSKEEISLILQEWEQSNLSKKIFCQQKQINYQTFIGWIVQRRNRDAVSEKKFIPVEIAAGSGGAFAEIYLSGSRRIVLLSAVDADFMRSILKC